MALGCRTSWQRCHHDHCIRPQPYQPQVLCASNDAHDNVDPIIVPEGVPVGERITFEG